MKPKPKVKAVPVLVYVQENWWAWRTAVGTAAINPFFELGPSIGFDSGRLARRHAREFWAQYGCKVRFVK